MTDELLKGLAAQAFNIAKKDMERGVFTALIASYFEGEGLRRMKVVEKRIAATLGEDWLNSGHKKDVAFDCIRFCVDHVPPDVVIIATVINRFTPTAKFHALPVERKKKLAGSGDECHQAVRDGWLTVCDALNVIAQTPERVCLYLQNLDGSNAECEFFPQAQFGGRLKMFGEEQS
jgi:hypothetical protein